MPALPKPRQNKFDTKGRSLTTSLKGQNLMTDSLSKLKTTPKYLLN
ncbi:MAG: hypothetical protein ACK5P3_12480 [Dolichospermum sp.]